MPNLPTDGSSHITKKVEYAISNGISVIVPSGNFAQKHWEGQFSNDVPDYSTLELFSVNNSMEYPISESSVMVPEYTQGVIVVGAIDNNSGMLESFSSQGTTNNGQSVPSVVGPTGVTTIAYGGNLFYGTSATTHVAGIVALMIDVNSELSPDELLEEIEQNAKADFTQTNPNQYGFGMVDAAFLIEN